MAYFDVSEYGKYISLQNVSGSGDPASAPAGGVYLFASGTAGSAKLYLRNEGGAAIDLTEAGILDLAGDSGTGEVDMAAQGSLTVDTGDGLSSVASGSTITISVDNLGIARAMLANDVIDGSKIENDAVDSEHIALGALDSEHYASGSIENGHLAGSIASSKIAELSNFDTGDLAEGSNLYYTEARWDAKMAAADTGDLAEGSNLYWTTARGESMFDSKLAAADTDDLSEGSSNLYYTDARARASVSVTDAGGDGSLSYDNSTGVFTFTGPSASEVRAHFSAGTGVSITDGEVAIGQAVATDSDVQFNDIQADGNVVISGNLTINGSQNVVEADTVLFKDTLLDMGMEDDGSGGLQLPSAESSKDQGLVFNRYVGSNNRKTAFFWDESADKFRMADQVAETDGVLSAGNLATLQANLEGDVTGDVTGQVSDVSNHDTDDIAEGSSNLYYTDARARAAVSADGDLISYNSSTGLFSTVASAFSASWDVKMAAADTDDLSEGSSNLYFTDARARGAVSVTDAGGDGSLAYDSSTGVITYTGPSASEVRAHFSAGTGVAIADGEISVGQAIGTSDSPEFASLQVSDLSQGRIVLAGASGELEDSASLRFAGGLFDLTASAGISLNGSVNFANGYMANTDYGMSFDSSTGQLVARGLASFDGGVNALGGYGGSGVSISSSGIQSKVQLQVGADGAGQDVTFFGGAANEALIYDASENHLKIQDSSAANILTIGGDASSEFAIDVANGSDNINKIRAAAFVTYSDESLKTDVTSMENTALDTIMSLNGVEFTWKNNGERDFGFIAQEVAAVLPKAVHTNEGVSGVDYSRLTSVLVEAVKAQQVQIEDLKKALLKK
jgi:hypothetical protein